MERRTLIQVEKPTTQTVESVELLLAYIGRASDPMPIFVELKDSVRLTRSKKGDCYYCTTPTDCSCKARTFNPGTQCKHMLALRADQANKIESESIRPKVPSFKPFDLLPSEERAARARGVA
ncbi:MAG: hypothetical protein WC455_21460 [Dehalococcoidia bacterium]|jgi:hypothetical protein